MAAASLLIPATVSLDGEALTAPAVSLGALGYDMGGGGGICKIILASGGDDLGCQKEASCT